jgi:hypothetical protein
MKVIGMLCHYMENMELDAVASTEIFDFTEVFTLVEALELENSVGSE